MATSQNGYPANDPSLITSYTIPGSKRIVHLKRGDAGFLLVDIAAWFHANVEPIDTGTLDDWGYAERTIRGDTTTLSNHASGTAIDLNATKHPLEKRGTFTAKQTAAIRAQLAKYDGCIRWGGDYSGRPDEMHFEINKPLADVSVVARRLRTLEVDPMAALLTDLRAVAKSHNVSLVYAARVCLSAAAKSNKGGRLARIKLALAALKGMK